MSCETTCTNPTINAFSGMLAAFHQPIGPIHMRLLPTAVTFGLIAFSIAGCSGEKKEQTQAAAPAGAQTEEDKTLYALGAAVARNIQPFDLTEAELKQVQRGFADGAMKK